jgi:glucose-6-phosphate isomerase
MEGLSKEGMSLDSKLHFLVDDGAAGSFPQTAQQKVDTALQRIHLLFQDETEAPLAELERGLRAWTRSHLQTEDIAQVAALATRAREAFSVLVIIGVGGSDLSARVFHDSFNHPYHNLLSVEERGGAPEVYFTGDTFDPRKLDGLLEMLKARNLLDKTLFNVISKSGTTTETMATLMVIRDALDDVNWQQQVLATTGLTADSVLFRMHEQSPFYGDTLLPVPDGVGGRFSAFSPVGLFFLTMTAGKNETPDTRIRAAVDGVNQAHESFNLAYNHRDNIAYQLARWIHLSEEVVSGQQSAVSEEAVSGQRSTEPRRGGMFIGERCPEDHSLNIVFYNYADGSCLGEWFVQLYTESIQERGGGANVINAKGPTSNHSILNGIIAGPRDKAVLFIHWEELGSDLVLPKETGMDSKLTEFEGLSMTHMQAASYRGTALDFSEKGIPNATLTLPKRDIQSVCQLMRLLMDTIAVKGRLQGLHLDNNGGSELTYLQEGVEGYKRNFRSFALTPGVDSE